LKEHIYADLVYEIFDFTIEGLTVHWWQQYGIGMLEFDCIRIIMEQEEITKKIEDKYFSIIYA
jgi:hypothetical protein